ncbi:uncharacterized protein LOC120173511 [Hibiscus syriacus]|uniref:uncharacterized protein LOC120173511 n=1 Tax=Hibiscus syriacus TaxID=106335 RepID=UPI001921CFC0|nr:uncharacterized protein LOC120173511 [Hibiscus syriacus]
MIILSSWSNLRVYSSIWKFIPGVVFWSIWKVRNSVVFERVKLDRSSIFFIVRFRLPKWFLEKFPYVPIQADSLIGDHSLTDKSYVSKVQCMPLICWRPPSVDFFKMNVDGTVRFDGLVGGINGILRDWKHFTLLTFSESAGPSPPPLAELKAIKKGIDIFLSSMWVPEGRLIVESDCKSAVEWIKSPSTAPTFFSNLVKDIVSLVSTKAYIVRLIPRGCNCEVDKLAKEGIG